jgi:GNAT superfamily N-acetyltransferase
VTGWTADAVLAAAADWTWVPPDARQLRTDDYQLVEYPEYYHLSLPVKVIWSRSGRPAGELIDEVAGQVREWGHGEVGWHISAVTRPAGTEAELARRGATVADTWQVLAYDMTGGLPPLDEPAGVVTKIVRDEQTAEASQRIQQDVWSDGGEVDQASVDRALAEARDGLADWSSFQVVAFIGGQPASDGGCTLAGGAARLWGGGTRPAFRGRGAYRAVLARRMAVARAHGATLALVKGLVDTSVPILRRAGFRVYGGERSYRLVLDGGTSR